MATSVTAESRHGLQIPRPSAGVFVLVAPVVFVGVDVVAAEDVVVGFADHCDGVGGDEDQYGDAGVGDADAEVVQSAAVAEGEFAELVDGVVADAEVRGGLAVGRRGGLWAGRGRLPGSPARLPQTSARDSTSLPWTRCPTRRRDVGHTRDQRPPHCGAGIPKFDGRKLELQSIAIHS